MKGQRYSKWLIFTKYTSWNSNGMMFVGRVRNHMLWFVIYDNIIFSQLHVTHEINFHPWNENGLMHDQHVSVPGCRMVIRYHSSDSFAVSILSCCFTIISAYTYRLIEILNDQSGVITDYTLMALRDYLTPFSSPALPMNLI